MSSWSQEVSQYTAGRHIPNITKHKCYTDVHDYRMRINGAQGKLAARGV